MNIMSKVHLWVGSTSSTSEQIEKYFDQRQALLIDPETGKDREQITLSNFAKDLDLPLMYNEDFLSVFTSDQSNLEELLEEVIEDCHDDVIRLF